MHHSPFGCASATISTSVALSTANVKSIVAMANRAAKLLLSVMLLGAALASSQTAYAEEKFVAVLHLLTTKGTYEKNVITTTADGVSRMECELRREAWLKEFGPMFDMASAQLQKESGKSTAYKVVCEKKLN
jgi:hypothetical protein